LRAQVLEHHAAAGGGIQKKPERAAAVDKHIGDDARVRADAVGHLGQHGRPRRHGQDCKGGKHF
jgi:hypothetical protein